ncbi:MAG: alanine--tRNA ligase [Candidatus Saccharimonadales bacterium]
MTAQHIRKAYLEYAKQNGHTIIPRASLVPQNDPTTLFTGSGMQPLLPYLLGEQHPSGTRVVDSQPCFRSEDIEEVGDNRHTTFFEMLGNWSFGDYFKQDQLTWYFAFLVDIVGLDPNKLYVTAFIGDSAAGVPKDSESAELWVELFKSKDIAAKIADIGSEEDGYKRGIKQNERIFYYDAKKNWWSRAGVPANMPAGEPGGPDSEVFYEFSHIQHDTSYGEHCHPNCDCGRFMEIGNSVFMQYIKNDDGSFSELPKANVDFGGGLERVAAASEGSGDMFKISLLWPIIQKLEQLSGKKYEQHSTAMRVIADHLRAATFLAVDGVVPSNKTQGYVMRRFLRRAIRYAFELGIEQNFLEQVVPTIADLYHDDYPEVAQNREQIIAVLAREEKVFRQTLRSGVREFGKLTSGGLLTGAIIFKLYDTYGFPVELTKEEAFKQDVAVALDATEEFDRFMAEQKARSQTAAKGVFKGGLADHSEITTKYHTATHLMYKALRIVLGDHVVQRGSNITAERLRFDFSHDQKVTPEQITQIEAIVNEQIKKDWPMSWREESTKEALANGVMGAFGDKYGKTVKVYTVGDPDGDNYSREICGGPHVTHTGKLADDGKVFKITKEQASSAGVRRIKAILM